MKKTTGRNQRTILKMVSLLAAVILWLFITYTEDSQMNVNIGSIDIQLIGEDYLNEQGLMVVNKSVIPKASVVVRGKRRDIIGVMDGISAVIDVSEVSKEGEYKLKPSFEIPSGSVNLSKQRTISVDIEVEKIEEKIVDVRVVQNNADSNKSVIVESTPVKDKLVIRGASEDLESIDHISAYVDVSNAINGGVLSKPVFENVSNTEVLTANDIFMESDEIEIVNNVYEKTSIPINILTGRDEKYAVKILEQSAEKVDAGIKNDDGRTVALLTNLPIEGELTVGTNEYELLLDVPDSIYVPEEQKTVKVKLEVFERAEAIVSVPITVRNAKGRRYELSSDSVNVRISGPAEKLKSTYISAVIDTDSLVSSDEVQNINVIVTTDEKDIDIKEYTSEIMLRIKD